ncbi:MAG: nucleoside phosphorylase [Firmicutes bacterium]|nr:nucleoside phosphorylase [Bacillota bacterium]
MIVFFQEILKEFLDEDKIYIVANLKSEAGIHPVYEMDYKGRKICLFHPILGGPLAAGFLEELNALGCTKFIACGGAGVLDPKLALGHLIVPSKALRAEGTSYHYLPASRYVDISPHALDCIESALKNRNIPYLKGITWTTDAFFRETKDMVQYRKEEGCITVEMECASFAAVAQFRKVLFGQILYAGDDLSKELWDSRKWQSRKDVRKELVDISIEACLKL